jgi:hypothetical protein
VVDKCALVICWFNPWLCVIVLFLELVALSLLAKIKSISVKLSWFKCSVNPCYKIVAHGQHSYNANNLLNTGQKNKHFFLK